MDNNKLFCLAFSHFLGIGPIKFKLLIKVFGTVEKAYEASDKKLVEILGAKTGEKFCRFRRRFEPEKKLSELYKKQITVITQLDPRFPQSLKNISDPPICLYVKGDISQVDWEKEFCFAVVGTRQPTSYGQQVTRIFARQLAEAGLVIVSGMAIGVDALAHQAALSAGKKTVAVLGCGVDIIYPAINARLYHQIIKDKGLVISEFPPGQMVLKGLFIARNRIISGLSRGVLIVEGAKDSGALITARYAAEQGKEVFAPPAPITSKMSAAPNLLLKEGAKLVTAVEDIFEEFNLKVRKIDRLALTKSLTEDEKKIFQILDKEPLLVDNLVLMLKKPAGELLSILSILEIKGLVEKDKQGKYGLKV